MSWPRLSETLAGQFPDACQRCGTRENLTRWQECDDQDIPQIVFVILCQMCANKIVEPHPRLYREVIWNCPTPGAMAVCIDCQHRDGLACHCPTAKLNGGPGIEFEPKGQMVHLLLSPRKNSGYYYMADGPVTKCSGFSATKKATPLPTLF